MLDVWLIMGFEGQVWCGCVQFLKILLNPSCRQSGGGWGHWCAMQPMLTSLGTVVARTRETSTLRTWDWQCLQGLREPSRNQPYCDQQHVSKTCCLQASVREGARKRKIKMGLILLRTHVLWLSVLLFRSPNNSQLKNSNN